MSEEHDKKWILVDFLRPIDFDKLGMHILSFFVLWCVDFEPHIHLYTLCTKQITYFIQSVKLALQVVHF